MARWMTAGLFFWEGSCMKAFGWLVFAVVLSGCSFCRIPEGRTYRVGNCGPREIVVDGQPNDVGWRGAVVEKNFSSPWDPSVRPGTTFRAMRDDDNLYFIFEVEDSTPVCLGSVTNKLQIDGEDRAEIFIAAN